MAKIVKFIKGNGSVSKRISEVECVYNSGIVDGEKYLSLSTYGSNTRENKGSASQVLHIDKKCAMEIIELLKAEFNI